MEQESSRCTGNFFYSIKKKQKTLGLMAFCPAWRSTNLIELLIPHGN